MSDGAAKAKGSAAWKTLVRILVAVGLLAVVLTWFVSWRDRVTWPSRFGAAPLVGRLELGVDHPRFHCDRGERSGTVLEFIPTPDGKKRL